MLPPLLKRNGVREAVLRCQHGRLAQRLPAQGYHQPRSADDLRLVASCCVTSTLQTTLCIVFIETSISVQKTLMMLTHFGYRRGLELRHEVLLRSVLQHRGGHCSGIPAAQQRRCTQVGALGEAR